MKFILVTVPHTGTRATIQALGFSHRIVYENFDRETAFPFAVHCSYSSRDFLMNTNARLLSTWRDPLRVSVSRYRRYPFLQASEIREAFEVWIELYRSGKLVVIDLRFLPDHSWMKPQSDDEKLPRVVEVERAYERKDLKGLERLIPEYFDELRKIDFSGLPLEEWHGYQSTRDRRLLSTT